MDKQRKKQPLFSSRYALYDFAKVTGALPVLAWCRPKILYENEAARRHIRGGALLIANHSAMADPVFLMCVLWYRRHRFICLKQFFEGKLRWLFTGFRCIPIDRENMGVDSFRLITECLQSGALVSMFPEGRVNVEDDNVAKFKSGMVLMAHRSGCPIVPVYMRPPKFPAKRLVAAVGEPLDVRALLGVRPSMKSINETAELLQKKENELKRIVEESI